MGFLTRVKEGFAEAFRKNYHTLDFMLEVRRGTKIDILDPALQWFEGAPGETKREGSWSKLLNYWMIQRGARASIIYQKDLPQKSAEAWIRDTIRHDNLDIYRVSEEAIREYFPEMAENRFKVAVCENPEQFYIHWDKPIMDKGYPCGSLIAGPGCIENAEREYQHLVQDIESRKLAELGEVTKDKEKFKELKRQFKVAKWRGFESEETKKNPYYQYRRFIEIIDKLKRHAR